MSQNEQLLYDLCNLEIPDSIKFSPDAQQVLYTTTLNWGHRKGSNSVSTIWLASPGQPNSSRQLTPGSAHDSAAAWHPNGKSIAFISDRAEPGKKWAIYLLSTDESHEADPITPVQNERPIGAFVFSPDGTSIAFLSADEKTAEQKRKDEEGEDVQVWGDWALARLRIVNLQTKQITSLDLDQHVKGLSWSPDGKKIGIVSCKTSDLEEPFVTGSTITIVDTDLTTVTELCHFPGNASDLTWANDGKLYFWAGFPAGTMFHASAVYAADSQASAHSYEKVAFGVESDACGLTHVNGKIAVKLQHRLESRISLLSGEVLYSKKEELQAFDVAIAPNTGTTIVAIATSDINHPVEVFTIAAGGGAPNQLSSHGDKFKGRDFGTCSFLSCLSTDGEEEIDSLYLTPTSAASKTGKKGLGTALPTIVLIHGGPNDRVTNAFNTYYYMLTPYLLSLGYGVLLPNYRGSFGRGEKFGGYTVGGSGTLDYADIIAATQHAIEQGYADRERLIVGGWSQGGFLTLHCSMRNGTHGYGWKFKGSIPGASICDVDAMALTSDFGSSFKPQIHQGRVIWNMDRSDTRNRAASALWQFSDAVKRSKQTGEMVVPPMLILHGADDVRCHVSNAWGMRRALESEGLPFEMVIYPRQGHIFQEQKFWIDMGTRVGRWCQKYIGEGIKH